MIEVENRKFAEEVKTKVETDIEREKRLKEDARVKLREYSN